MHLYQMLHAVGTDPNQVASWMRRIPMHTAQPKSKNPRQRVYTKDNILELALLNALVQAGLPAAKAAFYVGEMLQHYLLGDLEEWFVFASGDPTRGMWMPQPDLARAMRQFKVSDRPPVLTLVQVGEVVRRVERLFAEV